MADFETKPVMAQAEPAMPDPIPTSQSKIIITACVTILASILGLFGVYMTQIQQDTLTNALVALAPLGATLVTGIITIWARRRSIPAPIKGGPADPEVIQTKLLEQAIKVSRQVDLDKYANESKTRNNRR